MMTNMKAKTVGRLIVICSALIGVSYTALWMVLLSTLA
jgi:hypothetical protein